MDLEKENFNAMDLFGSHWAIVTAGTPERFNGCTVSWGSLGKLWTRTGGGSVVTVYIHPARFTSQFLLASDCFTVSFFPEAYKKALGYMGSHSGRDGDKTSAAGLTPVPMGTSVAYQEAELTFLCRKLYQHQFAKEDLAPEIREYYAASPRVYPSEDKDGWQPHIVFVGDILDVKDLRGEP